MFASKSRPISLLAFALISVSILVSSTIWVIKAKKANTTTETTTKLRMATDASIPRYKISGDLKNLSSISPDVSGLEFHPLQRPVRLLETRGGFAGCYTTSSQPLQANTIRLQPGVGACDGLTIPATAKALVGNVAVVPIGVTPSSYFTLWPSDANQPLVASGNYESSVVNTPFTVGLGVDGAFKIFTTSTTNMVIDIVGYYTPQGWINVRNYGAVGDGMHDDTPNIRDALLAASGNNNRNTVYFPAGTYRITSTIKIMNIQNTANAANGITLKGAGPLATVIKTDKGGDTRTIPFSGDAAIEATAASLHTVEIADIGFDGNLDAGTKIGKIGLYVHDNLFEANNITFRNLDIKNFSKQGVLLGRPTTSDTPSGIEPDKAPFVILLEGLKVSSCNGNGIEILGGNSVTLLRCYVDLVGSDKAGYRIYSGTPTLIGCNGIDSQGADWGVFGGTAPQEGYCFPTLIGCNVEGFRRGCYFQTGSWGSFFGTPFIARYANAVALEYDYVGPDSMGVLDGSSNNFQLNGGTWLEGIPVHVKNGGSSLPFIQMGGNKVPQIRYSAGNVTFTAPTITGSYPAYATYSYKISELQTTNFWLGNKRIHYADNFPSSPGANNWQQGDIIYKNSPTGMGDYVGWICIQSGNPGTWSRFGKIE